MAALTVLKDRIKRRWPALRLRSILLAVLLFAACMPAIGGVFLRSYENTLVRQTEAELTAQGAALAATAAALWPGAPATSALPEPDPEDPDYYRPEKPSIDLSAARILPERPSPAPSAAPPSGDATAAAARLDHIFADTTRSTLAAIVLTDSQGRVVRGLGTGGDLSALPEVRQALAGRSDTVLRRIGQYRQRSVWELFSRASAVRLHHARPVVVDGRTVGVLLLSRSPRGLFKGLHEDRGKLLLGAGVILLVLFGLAGLVSRGVTRPIEQLSAATRAMAGGRGEAPPETPRTAAVEIQALYDDFRAMAEAIDKRSRYLRDFAAALSHEFKTPLAGVRGAIELLQDHYPTMSQAERERFLANIAADNARLSALVGRLLELARADMATPEAGVAAAPLAAAKAVAAALSTPAFAVTAELPEGLPPVAAPLAMIETVLTVLVENSRQAGAGKVTIGARQDGRTVVLEVADDGPGVANADAARLFEPFFTTRRAQGGTGLGLSIARSLARAHGGDAAYVAGPEGARFALSLPAA
ncbi:histidine kinase [Caulobacter vibrioides]|nr:histidine kinase [Caulobacter vibrioides]